MIQFCSAYLLEDKDLFFVAKKESQLSKMLLVWGVPSWKLKKLNLLPNTSIYSKWWLDQRICFLYLPQ